MYLAETPTDPTTGTGNPGTREPGNRVRALTAAEWLRTVGRVAGPSIPMRIEHVVTMTLHLTGHA